VSWDIALRVRRGEALVERAVRGLKRPRLKRKAISRIQRRNLLIVRRVKKDRLSLAVVARRFRLTPTMVWQIVRRAKHRQPQPSAVPTSARAPPVPRRPIGPLSPVPSSFAAA
jgi:hypothetical protein